MSSLSSLSPPNEFSRNKVSKLSNWVNRAGDKPQEEEPQREMVDYSQVAKEYKLEQERKRKKVQTEPLEKMVVKKGTEEDRKFNEEKLNKLLAGQLEAEELPEEEFVEVKPKKFISSNTAEISLQ